MPAVHAARCMHADSLLHGPFQASRGELRERLQACARVAKTMPVWTEAGAEHLAAES